MQITNLDSSLPPLLSRAPLHLLHNRARRHHGALAVAKDGIDLRIFIDRLEDAIQSVAPGLLVPVLLDRRTLQLAHGVFGVQAARYVAQPA